MKVVGIIAEYNPFHNGHKYQMDKIRKETGADYVVVAYGTNDWSGSEESEFKEKCCAFYRTLSNIYPNSKVFAITPIWRRDYRAEKKFGPFENVSDGIESIVKDFENISCIRGFSFVPQDEKYFADLRLHPNDNGFEEYFQSLYREIQKVL